MEIVGKIVDLRFLFLYICFFILFILFIVNYKYVDNLSINYIKANIPVLVFCLYGLGGIIGIFGYVRKKLLSQFMANNLLIVVLSIHFLSIVFYRAPSGIFVLFLILFVILSLLYRNYEIKRLTYIASKSNEELN